MMLFCNSFIEQPSYYYYYYCTMDCILTYSTMVSSELVGFNVPADTV